MSEEQESLLEPVSMLNEDWQIISEQAKRIKELEELYANEEYVCTQIALECFRKDAKLEGRADTIRRLIEENQRLRNALTAAGQPVPEEVRRWLPEEESE